MSEQEVIRTTTTLLAVILGFLLSQLAEWLKGRGKSSRKQKSVRALIKLEQKENYKKINSLWSSVFQNNRELFSDDGNFLYGTLITKVAETPTFVIKKEAWLANMHYLASAFDETQLEELWEFYINLERIQTLHVYFVDSQNEHQTAKRHYSAVHDNPIIGAIAAGGFSDSAYGHAEEFKELLERLVENA
ncbi:hypothetical protein BKF97_RS23305 [Vibrio parahaemolyticus]|nr:hypothetical protein [Vibrio parahaemolyticus]